MTDKRTTIKDIARKANVSIATVSNVLNDIDVVKPKTKQRVLAIAEQLNYIPNLRAKQLQSGETKMIGFFCNSISGPYFNPLVESVAKVAEANGYGINILLSNDQNMLRRNILGNLVDGIIGFEDLISNRELQLLKTNRIKAVFIDRMIQDETIGSVTFDSFQKGKELTEYLIQQGHQKIGFILGKVGIYDSNERYKGFLTAMDAAGLSVDSEHIYHGEFELEPAYQCLTDFLKATPSNKYPTAIIAGNDLSAIGAYKAICDFQLRVPEDISLVSFDGFDLEANERPNLTGIHNPIYEQARLSVEHLIAMIHREKTGEAITIKGHFVEGNTVRQMMKER